MLELEQKYRNRILNQSYENLKQHNDQQRIITGSGAPFLVVAAGRRSALPAQMA